MRYLTSRNASARSSRGFGLTSLLRNTIVLLLVSSMVFPSKAASITFRASRTIAGSVWKWKSSSNGIALPLLASIPELPSAQGISDEALTKVLIKRWV